MLIIDLHRFRGIRRKRYCGIKGRNCLRKNLHGMEAMLTENDVVNAVQAALKQRGWTIRSFATTMQQGVDVVATLGKRTLYVEAKGITSSKDGSSRFGKVQTGSQMYISVAAALLKTAELRHANAEAAVAIALPKHPAMVKRIGGISTVLEAANIAVLWVGEDLRVGAWNAPWLKSTSKVA